MTSKDSTPYQRLALVLSTTGHRIQLQEFEELDGCMVTPDLVIILIRTVQTRSSGRACVIGRRGVKRVTIARTRGAWARPEIAHVWEDSDITTRVVADAPHTTYAERTQWERLCHRPGNAVNPRDSYARQLQGY